MIHFTRVQLELVRKLLAELIHQEKAQITIPAQQPLPGYWFGGGKLAQDSDGMIWLTGRYRNAGDSRTGLEAGVRGAECALFRSADGGSSFTKVRSWTKEELSTPKKKVISIEGTALHRTPDGRWELFISSEKDIPYPEEIRHFQKPGTGVWSIDRVTGKNPQELKINNLKPVLENRKEPAYLHVKDPFVVDINGGSTILVFCSHPFNWTSDNSGYAAYDEKEDTFHVKSWEMVSRGPAWDVAVTRITSCLEIPGLGCFSDEEAAAIYFYDGAECMRPHQENLQAVNRPRGYSCEEIGGAFIGKAANFPKMERISLLEPLFQSPWGTGSSRYIDCLTTEEGILATWQQSQPDGSQPLVRHFLPMGRVEEILSP